MNSCVNEHQNKRNRSTDRGEYMRQYMAKRYQQDPHTAQKYRNTCRARHQIDDSISQDDITRYGIYLANIIKLKKIIADTPKEFVAELMAQD